jgi:hypothetical protein
MGRKAVNDDEVLLFTSLRVNDTIVKITTKQMMTDFGRKRL